MPHNACHILTPRHKITTSIHAYYTPQSPHSYRTITNSFLRGTRHSVLQPPRVPRNANALQSPIFYVRGMYFASASHSILRQPSIYLGLVLHIPQHVYIIIGISTTNLGLHIRMGNADVFGNLLPPYLADAKHCCFLNSPVPRNDTTSEYAQ